MKGYKKFYNKQIKHTKKFLIEDLFGAYVLIDEYESEIKSLKKELKKIQGVLNETRNARKKI